MAMLVSPAGGEDLEKPVIAKKKQARAGGPQIPYLKKKKVTLMVKYLKGKMVKNLYIYIYNSRTQHQSYAILSPFKAGLTRAQESLRITGDVQAKGVLILADPCLSFLTFCQFAVV